MKPTEATIAALTARASAAETALAEMTQNRDNLNEAWKLSNQQLATERGSRRDEESWWKEKHDYQARAEAAESALATTQAELRAALERVKELKEAAKDVLFHFMPAHLNAASQTECGTKLEAAIRAAARPDAN